MMALYHRASIGEGQHVDVSIQQCLATVNMNCVHYWDMYKFNIMRGMLKTGLPRPDGTIVYNPNMQPCKDGYMYIVLGGGALKSAALSSAKTVKLMDEEGMAGDLRDYDWSTYDSSTITQEEVNHQVGLLHSFLMKHTKAEIYEEAIKRGILGCPIQDAKDIAKSPQLAARDFFVKVEHPELGDTLTYCGPWARMNETPLAKWVHPPLIGEHNRETYEKELGLTREQLSSLKQAGVI